MKALILVLVLALGDREGLAVRLGLESRRPDVRHPDLDRPQTLLAQPLTVRSHLVSRGSGRGCHGQLRTDVTCHLPQVSPPGETDITAAQLPVELLRIHVHGWRDQCDRSVLRVLSGRFGGKSSGCAAEAPGRGGNGGFWRKGGRRVNPAISKGCARILRAPSGIHRLQICFSFQRGVHFCIKENPTDTHVTQHRDTCDPCPVMARSTDGGPFGARLTWRGHRLAIMQRVAPSSWNSKRGGIVDCRIWSS